MAIRMNRRVTLGSLLALGTLALAGCGYRRETFRYRITVEVQTPEGIRSGSSVIEVKLAETGSHSWVTPEASGVRGHARGEAVAVELPGAKVLFALLRTERTSDGAVWFPFRAIKTPKFEGEYSGVRRARYMERNKLAGALLPRDYPMLVTFRDPTDPQTVERVDPDDLAATFGPGVTLRRITVQMTDDPVTNETCARVGVDRGVGC